MRKMTNTRAIIKEIGDKRLNLYNGGGYWYFILDDGAKLYETHSIYVYLLNELSHEQWVEAGRDFIKEHTHG